ncbi:anti-sigma factor domain-containing protein [Pararhodobacter oceanensis]|uniref:anti-sigma factor n=1 Tax=Pararhodobacter oceanensis TaxID=2172121 RepID=UPI003A8E234F
MTQSGDHTPEETPEQRDDLLAAEYVLGVLTGDAWRAAAERAQVDGAFAAQVARWEERLAGLNEAYAEVPAADLMPLIEARLFPAPTRARRRWFTGFAAAALSASVVLAVVLWPQAPAPVQVQLVGEDARFVADYDGAALEFALALDAAGEGRDYELWAIGDDGVPRSLGLLRGPVTRVEAELPAGVTLAVSLEPAGGAPGDLPTGPVLATAVLPSLN